MPKETYTITNFAKGLMSHVEARDLDDDAIYLSEGIDYSDVGKIRIIGDGFGDALSSDIQEVLGVHLSGGTASSERIVTFQHDYDLGIKGDNWAADDSFSGYIGIPKFRNTGVTYYIVTSGEDRNQITLVASYQGQAEYEGEEDGERIFSVVKWNRGRYNSIGKNHPLGWGNADGSSSPDNFYGFGGTYDARAKMRVGPDSNATIVGYWVDGGFRYCDANFNNKNNNIVGYIGHINRSYLTSLSNMKHPAEEDDTSPGEDFLKYTDASFTRNHWHFNTYENVWAGAADPTANGSLGFWDTSAGEENPLLYRTQGMYGMLDGAWQQLDGFSGWNMVLRNNPESQTPENFRNYRMYMHVGPNVERVNDWQHNSVENQTGHGGIEYGGDGLGVTDSLNTHNTNEQNGSSITFGQGASSGDFNETSDSTPLYKGEMPDGHELRKQWIFGTSVLYDGDPRGICQETGICTVYQSTISEQIDTVTPRILNLKDQSEFVNYDQTWRNPWIRILGSTTGTTMRYYTNEDSANPTSGKLVRPADFDALPKIYFSWTFLPWWADTEEIINDYNIASYAWDDITEDANVTMSDHLGYTHPPYDARMTGFRLYMQSIENKENIWHNVATVDAMRGMVYYNGCSIKEHAWIPRGYLNGDAMVPRLERGHPLDGVETQRVACWSNMSTGRSNIDWKHDGTSIQLNEANEDRFGNFGEVTSFQWANLDPHVNSKCNKSVNIESIPDPTYELLNGYKHNFSPTQLHHRWDANNGPIIYNKLDGGGNTIDTSAVAQTFGSVYRFKTSTVLNDRVYIGNIMDNRTLKHQPDRILKTEPGQYDIFPDDGFHHIDLATTDGDSIIKIMAHDGKLFVWKHHTLYVLKITEDGDEVIESQHSHYGIDNEYQVTTTKHGPCWFNEGGLYLYTHENKIENLIAGKLSRGKYMPDLSVWLDDSLSIEEMLLDMTSENEFIQGLVEHIVGDGGMYPEWWDINDDGHLDSYDVIGWVLDYHATWHTVDDIYVSQIEYGWRGFVASDGSNGKPSPMIGYVQNDDKIIIYKSSNDNGLAANSGDAYLYDFTMKNFSFGKHLFPSGKGVTKSNFVHDSLGNLVYLANFTPHETSTDNADVRMYKWDEEARDKHAIRFVTKDIDFKTPGIRKKVYKIYISASGELPPNVNVFYAINGSKKFKPSNIFTGVQNYDINEGFQPPGTNTSEWVQDRWYTAILKPHSSGESLGNIYSIQLMFIGKNEAELSSQDEVEDTPPLESNKNTGAFVSKTFQINDITIVYRTKNAR